MIEAKYYRDYGHNYLILKCIKEDEDSSYRYRMLSLNKVDGLLNYSIRNINGSTCLYYDISSKISIKNFYQNKKLSYDQVKDLFIQMDQICRNLSHYFLEERELLLQPQYIFFDLARQQYFGVYYPQTDAEENPYEVFLDFLLEHIDTEEQELASKLYKFYEMAEDNLFSLADGAADFLDDNTNMPEINIEADNIKEQVCINEAASCETDMNEISMNKVETSESEIIEIPYSENTSGPTALFYIILSVLSLIGAAGCCLLYMLYELTQKELMVLFGCGIITILSSPLCAFLAWRTRKRNKEKQMVDRQIMTDIEDEFRDNRQISLENVLDRNTYPIYPNTYEYRKVPAENKENDNLQLTCGETVFIDLNKREPEYKLYALDPKNKKHIDLTHFPYTIGKMAGCVDCVLTDASISRLHARIERKEGKLFLTDMNSTNGTYKNGLQMGPSETIEIEPGDEIRFGKLNYCYR